MEKSKPKRLPILDSLRGLAALIVLYHHLFKLHREHIREITGSMSYDILNYVSGLNQEAVLFFFILSGFSIGLSLKGLGFQSNEDINQYFYRRFKRILPLYWIALLLTSIAGALMQILDLKEFNYITLLGNLAFLQTSSGANSNAWVVPYGLNGPLWSLSFEMFFYMFFPVAYLLNKKYANALNRDLKFLLLLVLSIGSFIANKLVFIPYLSFFSLFIIWLLGYLCSKVYLLNYRYKNIFLFSLVFGALYITIGKMILESDTLRLISKGLIMSSLFYFCILLHEACKIPSSLNAVIKYFNIVFNHLGRGSYAIYALHYPILLLLKYYNVVLIYQIPVLLLFMALCIPLEELTIRWKMVYLKLNYSTLILQKTNIPKE